MATSFSAWIQPYIQYDTVGNVRYEMLTLTEKFGIFKNIIEVGKGKWHTFVVDTLQWYDEMAKDAAYRCALSYDTDPPENPYDLMTFYGYAIQCGYDDGVIYSPDTISPHIIVSAIMNRVKLDKESMASCYRVCRMYLGKDAQYALITIHQQCWKNGWELIPDKYVMDALIALNDWSANMQSKMIELLERGYVPSLQCCDIVEMNEEFHEAILKCLQSMTGDKLHRYANAFIRAAVYREHWTFQRKLMAMIT